MGSAIPASILFGAETSKHDAAAVGVQYFAATPQHPPLRVFYPAQKPTNGAKSVGWFQDTGLAPFLLGYAHMSLIRHDNWKFRLLLRPLLQLLSWILPFRWLRIPGVYQDAPCISSNDSNDKLPLIAFSHGLTGTGQENSVLCAAWARQGFIVVQVHHTDGSSCRVQLADGSIRYYQHGPPFSNYDPSFRPRQVNVRAQELLQAYEFMIASQDSCTNTCLKDLRNLVDPSCVIASGFSYGATTAARAAVMENSPFAAALFLDGWFHIDVKKSAGVEFHFPSEAFDKGLSVPTHFINSQQFAGFSKLYSATQKLANGSQISVLKDTGHQNFCDVVFWIHYGILKRLMRGAIGESDPVQSYGELVEQSVSFLRKIAQDSTVKGNKKYA